jgi:adenosylhomocysteine nucleosidase
LNILNDIIIIAIPEEAPELQKYENVLFSGIGKINATFCATQAILKYNPRRIINFGTAGGITVGPGFYQCKHFFQRDMDCTALNFKLGQTPYEEYEELNDGIICGSGDNFVTTSLPFKLDIVDMEAYAIHKVCKKLNVDFLCYKYITDNADSKAAKDWSEVVSTGQKHYIEKLKELSIELKKGKQ